MAVTTIPWGDGSGDNIYLTYSASQGDQTVLVSSDANSGVARQKVITFISTVGNISRNLTVSQEEGASLVSITWDNVCITYDDTAIGYQDTSPQYVQDGLVFWLDGIDKGEGADTWVEKKNGYVFTNHGAIFNPDHVYLDGTAYLDNSTVPGVLAESGTIEVVYEKESEYGLIYVPVQRNYSDLAFGFVGSGYGTMWHTRTNRARYLNIPSKASVSISLARALGNGFPLTQNGTSNISLTTGDPSYVGRRGNGVYFTGKIHCIRIYNRQLTEAEVLANYAVDEARFHLGYGDNIVFADHAVEQICVDTFGDGTSLSTGQAALVFQTQISTLFKGNTDIVSFDELQYFTGLYEIPAQAFQNCSNLASVVLPSKVRRLGNYCFQGTALTEFTFPDYLVQTAAMVGLFHGCASLVKLYNFDNFWISNYMFTGCSAMSEVHARSVEAYLSITNSGGETSSPFRDSSAETRGLYVNNQLVTSITIPSTITSIWDWAFYKNNTLQSITFHSNITSIGNGAFNGCTSLHTVSVPSSITSIEINAFANSGDSSNTSSLTINTNVICAVKADSYLYYNKITINGNVDLGTKNAALPRYGTYTELRISGNVTKSTTQSVYGLLLNAANLLFCEVMGTITDCNISYGNVGPSSGVILHLGYNGIAATPSQIFTSSRWSMIYVGDGSSASHDNAILTQYTNDTDWSAYTDKLDTWYNYINDPDANPDFIN